MMDWLFFRDDTPEIKDFFDMNRPEKEEFIEIIIPYLIIAMKEKQQSER